jgi:hypothetical protein
MSESRKFRLIGNVFSLIWHKIPFVRQLMLNYGVFPMTLLFGVPISAIATKPIKTLF